MRLKLALVAIFFMAVLAATTVPVMAAPSATYTDTYQYVNQRQWRSRWTAFGTYTDLDDSGPYYTYKFAGQTIHEWISYSPPVTDQEGGHFVYTLQGSTATLHSGVIIYTSPYSFMTIYEVWSGYMIFDGFTGTNDDPVFNGGWQNQWAFVYGDESIKAQYPNAIDMGDGWWLVGFSTYAFGDDYADAVSNSPSGVFPGGDFWTLALNPPHVP